jgi:hypothetical protein
MLRRLTILAVFLSAQALATENYRKQPCKTPALAPSCVQMHGRLRQGSGNPSMRLWQIGTTHIYGIYTNKYGFDHDDTIADNEGPTPPANIDKLRYPEGGLREIYGDFEVCPLEPPIEGHMQAACIANASHVIASKD